MTPAQKPVLHVAQIGFLDDPQRRPARELSFAALGAKLAAMYTEVTGRSGRTVKAECALHPSV